MDTTSGIRSHVGGLKMPEELIIDKDLKIRRLVFDRVDGGVAAHIDFKDERNPKLENRINSMLQGTIIVKKEEQPQLRGQRLLEWFR